MKPLIYSVLLSALVSGCTVNLQRDRDEEWRNEVYHSRDRTTPEWVSERKLTNCPVYTMPEGKQVPSVPAEQYRRVPKSNYEKREEILLDYIEALREHIKATKSSMMDQYMKYLMQCTASSKPK